MGNNKISQLQLISIGGVYVMGTIIVAVFISSTTLNESWLMGAIGAICFIPVIMVYCSLSKKYPGKNLLAIYEEVFGSFCGRVVSFIYLIFFFSLCAINILDASNFLRYFAMTETPLLAIVAFLMAACVYCAKKGLAPIARASTIFGIVAATGIMLNVLLSLTNMNISYLFPIFNLKLLDYIQGAHIAISIPYGGSMILMMLVPDLSEKGSIKKAYISVTIITAIVMTLVHFREVITLGPMIAYVTLPSFEAVRMIDFANILSRTESVFVLLIISLTFFKSLILFYICASSTAQVFRLGTYRHMLIMLAALLTVYSVNVYGSGSTNIYMGKNVSPFIWIFFIFVFPLFTLIFSVVKRFIAKKRKGIAQL